MNSFILSALCLLTFVTTTHSVACMICNNAIGAYCGSPFSGYTSSPYLTSGYTSCIKYVYTSSSGTIPAGTVARYGSNSACTGATYSDAYGTGLCCSNTDGCNGAIGHTASVFAAISLMIGSLLAKLVLFS